MAALVDGEAISRAELEVRVRTRGQDASAALRELEAERLWAGAARARGYADRPEVRDAARRAEVRALLSEIEGEVPESSVDEAALRAHFEATRGRYNTPERRDVVHVLIPVGEDAAPEVEATAHERATRMARRLGSAPEAERADLLDVFDAELGAQVEPVPGVTRSMPFDEAFLQAIFSSESVGVLSRPVRASDGWHVIWVRAIQPASLPVFADHRQQVLRSLLALRRGQKLQELLARLRASAGVRMDEASVRRLLAELPAAR